MLLLAEREADVCLFGATCCEQRWRLDEVRRSRKRGGERRRYAAERDTILREGLRRCVVGQRRGGMELANMLYAHEY